MHRRSSADRANELRWAALGMAWLVLVVVMLGSIRRHVDPGTAALALVPGPLLAARGSLRAAASASVLGALAFNVVFTQPYGSLRISSSTSITAFVVYLVIALTMALAIEQLRRAERTSRRRAHESALIQELSVELLRQNVWLQPSLDGGLRRLAELLDLRSAAIELGDDVVDGGSVSIGEGARSQRAALPLLASAYASAPAPTTTADLLAVPIAAGERTFGALAVERERGFDTSSEQVVHVFANLVALWCDRARFAREAVDRSVLEQAEQHRVRLVQSVSHDLRTPLTSIRALASTVGELGPLLDAQREVLADIDEQTQRLARMVDQVLDLSRIDSGMLRPRLTRVALDDLVRAAVAQVAPRLSSPDELTVNLGEDVGLVPVDEPLIRQVVVNLLENALRHGAPPFEVALRARTDSVEIAVRDHGKGVPEADRRRMFDASWAMQRASADERSTGLGLVVAAGFARAHGGHLRVEPTDGGGATFVISLPREARVSS
jgi:two-component system sensor histidine kinase KdpD